MTGGSSYLGGGGHLGHGELPHIQYITVYEVFQVLMVKRVHFTFGARLEIIGKNEDKGRNNEKKSGGDESGVDEASRSGH